MMRVDLWIAIGGDGRGAIALTREDAVAAVGQTARVAVARFASWSLSWAMVRGEALPIRFAIDRELQASERRAVVPAE
jgi:hypothetical protein